MKLNDFYLLVKKHFIPDLEKTGSNTDSSEYTSQHRGARYELKVRKATYDTYLIEKVKYDDLMDSDGRVYFINYTPKGIYSWNLRKTPEPDWIMELHPVTTNVPDITGGVSGKKAWKEVGYLFIDDAIKLVSK